ncbi:MAG: helix-turn-helix transcriptional regulator [Victivallales bacterium]|nr:helix-turn-helix transcriptional regulator [Victivallales bacterium]
MNRRRRSQDLTYQEDYWYNTSEVPPEFPGLNLHALCHSFLMPQWSQSANVTYNYIMASLILSGKEEAYDEYGKRILRHVGFFSITDLNEAKNTLIRQSETLERYFVLFHVNRLLRQTLAELFPSGLPKFVAPSPQKLRRCFEDIRRVLRKKGTTDNQLLSAMGFKLLTEAASQEKSMRHVPLPLTLALRYLDSNFFKPDCSRDDIARAAQVSAVTLGKLFREHLHTSINRYLTALRIEKAKQLLEFSSETVNSISAKCGYAWAYYFAKCFEEAVGMTPLQYRKERRRCSIVSTETTR